MRCGRWGGLRPTSCDDVLHAINFVAAAPQCRRFSLLGCTATTTELEMRGLGWCKSAFWEYSDPNRVCLQAHQAVQKPRRSCEITGGNRMNRIGYVVAATLLLSLPAAAHTPQQPPHQ